MSRHTTESRGSKMKNLLKATLFISILILTVAAVQAELYVNVVSDEFSIESPYPVHTVKECQCGTRTEVVKITNLGDFDTLFTLQIDSPISQYMTISRDKFSLIPGEATEVNIYITAPCDLPINSFYIIRVSTNYGREKELYKEFTSAKCQNIKFTNRILNSQVYPGQPACSEIELQNAGDFQDSFTITPNIPYSYASRPTVELEGGEKTKLNVCTILPVENFGTVNQPFTITSQKANSVSYGGNKYEILRDYDFTVKTENELDVCAEVTTQKMVTVENLARTPNEYYLSFKGPTFVNATQNAFTLSGYESETTVFGISPAKTDVGEYELSLNTKTKYGQMSKDRQFKLVVSDCYNLIATIDSANAVSEKSCCGEKSYSLNIINKGLFEEAYQVIVDSEGWLSIDSSNEFVRLKPAQQVNIPVTANLPCTDSKSTSYVIVKQLKAPYKQVELKINLESLSKSSCQDVELLVQNYEINYDIKSISLLVQNNGLQGGEYRLELEEDPKIKNSLQLLEKNLTLDPGEVKAIHLIPSNMTGYQPGRYLNKLVLVPTGQAIEYDRQFWVALKPNSFFVNAMDFFRGINYTQIGFCGFVSLVIAAIIILLLIFALYAKKRMKIKRIKAVTIKKLRVFNMFVVALLLACILLLVVLGAPDDSRFYESPSNTTNPLTLEWKENTAYSLDLSNYFSDPDNDILGYSANQPDHIHVNIRENIATMTPEFSWSGTEYAVFTANDAKGGLTDSPAIAMHILHRQPIGLISYWSLYCRQINIVLLMLILLVVLLITDIFEEKGYRHYLPK
jgi:hypothetical protein